MFSRRLFVHYQLRWLFSTNTENLLNNVVADFLLARPGQLMQAYQGPRTAQDHVTSILSGSNEYISNDPLLVYQVLVAVAQYARQLEEALATTTAAQSISAQSSQPAASFIHTETFDETDAESDDGVLVDSILPKSLRQITRNISANRFYGKSSSLRFVKSVMEAKTEATGENSDNIQSFQRPDFWCVNEVKGTIAALPGFANLPL